MRCCDVFVCFFFFKPQCLSIVFLFCFISLGFAGQDLSSLGIPTDKEFMKDYCQRAGVSPVKNWNFYMAFSFFRLAAILQGVYKRALQGNDCKL